MAKASPKGHHYLRILATQCNPSRKKGKENRRRSKRKNNIKKKNEWCEATCHILICWIYKIKSIKKELCDE